MNDNEKAAVAAGLWEPGIFNMGHGLPAPDMHLPENLWRALEHLIKREIRVSFYEQEVMLMKWHDDNFCIEDKPDLFAALVALYDAGEGPSPLSSRNA